MAAQRPAWLTTERLYFAAIGLTALGLVPLAASWRFASASDWSVFAAAGRHAGGMLLLHPPTIGESYPYTPGSAWLWVPFAHLSLAAGMFANALLMLIAAVAAALVAARVFNRSAGMSLALVCAWTPTMNALVVGQNSPFGLALVMLSIWGLQRRDVLLTAVPLGVLLYKPTYALPLIALLALRGRVRELGVVVIAGAGWYLLSVAATGGDWIFPIAWAHSLHAWTILDFPQNAEKAISIPSLLMRAGVPFTVAIAAGALVALATIPMLRRLPIVEAACAACAAGLAVSPHAWAYDGVLLLPSVFVAVTELREPLRTRIIGGAYAIAALVTFMPLLHADAVAVLVLGTLAGWFARSRSIRSLPRAVPA
jgi:hypothetical protein